MEYIKPQMEITRFDEREVSTVTVSEGHTPGEGDVLDYENY